MSMRALRSIALVAPLLLGLTACSGGSLFGTPWPNEGTGGFGEYQPIENERALDQDRRLEAARLRQASTFAAADYENAKTAMVRIRREIIAGLDADAEKDMNELDIILARIEARLSKIHKRSGA
jgi:hypothetical protein